MKILRGTIFGGVFYFLLGWLVYGILLMDFFSTGMNQCLNRPEGDMVWWAIIVSNLAAAMLLTLVLKWSGAKGFIDGLKTGATLGFLYALIVNMSFLSMTTMFNNYGTLVADLIVSSLVFALTGMVIVLLWGKE